MTAKKPRPGRPTLYTEDLAAEFCARLIEARHGYRDVVKAADMPAGSTFFLWLNKHPEFAEMYRAALELRAIAMNEEMLEIADTPAVAETRKTKPDGSVEVTTGDAVEHRKLRVSARQWALARFNPKRFGNHQVLEHTGKDGGSIVHALSLTDDQLAAIAASRSD